MKLFNVLVPFDFIIERRTGARVQYNFRNSINMDSSERRSVSNNARVNSFINGLLTADLSKNKYVENIFLRSGENAVYFKLREPIIPIMAIRENRKYIFDEETRKKIYECDNKVAVTHLKMMIPSDADHELKIWAWNEKCGELSSHPNSGDDHICYGTYRDRVKIGRVQISKLVDLLRIANLDSAYRNFRYDINWNRIPNEAY